MKIPDYPLKLNQNNPNKVLTQRTIRPTSVKQWKDNAKLKCAQESFSIDVARLWNKAPQSIHMAESLQIAKNTFGIGKMSKLLTYIRDCLKIVA